MYKAGEDAASFHVLQAILQAYRSGSFKALDAAIKEGMAVEHDILLYRQKQHHKIKPLVVGKVAV